MNCVVMTVHIIVMVVKTIMRYLWAILKSTSEYACSTMFNLLETAVLLNQIIIVYDCLSIIMLGDFEMDSTKRYIHLIEDCC